jgi:hypothetical protein
MSPSSPPTPLFSKWSSRSVIALLTLQVGLLWIHGSLIQRQHDDIQALRGDVQALADSLDQDQDDDDTTGAARPVRSPVGRHGRVRRVAFQQAPEPPRAAAEPPDPGDSAAAQELEAAKRSAQEAVAKARDTQEKMSIPENIRLADEKARLAAAGKHGPPWPWIGAGAAAVLALWVRAHRRRG